MRIENERTSFLSRKKGKKSEMLRFYVQNGELHCGDGPGRGYYLFIGEIETALAKGRFQKILSRKLTEEEERRIKNGESSRTSGATL